MKIGFFVPCYLNHVMPHIAEASYVLLKSFNINIEYPLNQTCCGQPLSHEGEVKHTIKLAKQLFKVFKDYDYIVSPSASCIAMIHDEYKNYLTPEEHSILSPKAMELCTFLIDILKIKELPKKISFPYSVSIHNSCQGLRKLHVAELSELNKPYFSKMEQLLAMVDDIKIVKPQKIDECCGFGGSFTVDEPYVSVNMGKTKIADHKQTNADFIVSYDPPCLIHLNGIISRNKEKIQTIHISQILSGVNLPC